MCLTWGRHAPLLPPPKWGDGAASASGDRSRDARDWVRQESRSPRRHAGAQGSGKGGSGGQQQRHRSKGDQKGNRKGQDAGGRDRRDRR